MKTATNNSDNYIKGVYKIKKAEEQKAVDLFIERTGIEVTKKHGNFYIVINDVFTDDPTPTVSLYFKYIGYGSISFLGMINGKTKEQLRYKTPEIQKETENLILKLHYTSKETREAIDEIEKQHGKSKIPIGIIRDKIFYNK